MKNLKYIYAFIFTVALTGCSDFLDQVPDTRVDLTTTEHARQLMNTAYPTYNYGWACEIMSDNIIDNNSPDENGVRFNLSSYDIGDEEMYRWEQNRSNSGLDSPSMIWQGYYLSIANANATLELLNRLKANQGGILDETQSAIRGEALLLRAYAHFTLATVFCEPYRGPELGRLQPGIPYITEPETTVKASLRPVEPHRDLCQNRSRPRSRHSFDKQLNLRSPQIPLQQSCRTRFRSTFLSHMPQLPGCHQACRRSFRRCRC